MPCFDWVAPEEANLARPSLGDGGRGEPSSALRLDARAVAVLDAFGLVAEGRRLTDLPCALAMPARARKGTAARAAGSQAGNLAYWQGRPETGRMWYEEQMELAEPRRTRRGSRRACST